MMSDYGYGTFQKTSGRTTHPLCENLHEDPKMMSESHIEKALVRAVKRRGGLALKFISPGMSGVPDRLILFSDGRLAFIEVKAPGEKMRPLQIKRKGQLEALGFLVYCLDDVKVIGEMLDELCAP